MGKALPDIIRRELQLTEARHELDPRLRVIPAPALLSYVRFLQEPLLTLNCITAKITIKAYHKVRQTQKGHDLSQDFITLRKKYKQLQQHHSRLLKVHG
jgi:hypothetical protein